MKVVFIASTYATIVLIFWKFRATYDSEDDSFRAEVLVIPAAGLAVLVNHEFSVFEVSTTIDPCYRVYGTSEQNSGHGL